jgi:hypothetical protein
MRNPRQRFAAPLDLHSLHSLDPMAGVDIGEVKRRYGDQ